MTMFGRDADHTLPCGGRRRGHRELAELLRRELDRPVDASVSSARRSMTIPAVYAKSSPIDFIKKVKTPTLVVVGDRDGECPAPQSFEFWHALQRRGRADAVGGVSERRPRLPRSRAPHRCAGADAGLVRSVSRRIGGRGGRALGVEDRGQTKADNFREHQQPNPLPSSGLSAVI